MTDDSGTGKMRRDELHRPQPEDPDSGLTGEEIDKLADLFALALPEDDDEDTGPFQPVSDEDTGKFKPVVD